MFHIVDGMEVLCAIDSQRPSWTRNYGDRLLFTRQEADAIIRVLESQSPNLKPEKVEENADAIAGRIASQFYLTYKDHFEIAESLIAGNLAFGTQGVLGFWVQFRSKLGGWDRVAVDLASRALLFTPGLSSKGVAVEIDSCKTTWWTERGQLFDVQLSESDQKAKGFAIAIADLCAIRLFNELEFLGAKLMGAKK